MNSRNPILQITNVGKEYYGNRVLKDISFDLYPGEILGLVGENGAGKSTLMNILFGMPVIADTGGYEGTISINGTAVRFRTPFDALDAGIGMVHQEFSLIPGFTTTENILLNSESQKKNILDEVFGPRMDILDRPDMRRRALEAIGKLGIQLDPEMCVSEMPVGHKQFTEIAREIIRKNMKILVLDEPTAVLTESEASILLDGLKKLAGEGIGIIFISHRLQEVLDLTDKVVVLRDGLIAHEAPTAGLTIREIARRMVGRGFDSKEAEVRPSRATDETVLEVENLWVDMPGETVRDVSFSVRRGEIFGIGGLAGQGKLGIPNGIMGLMSAGGSVHFRDRNGVRRTAILNDPRSALEQGMAFVSEDRRGVGLLLDEPVDWNIVFTSMQIQGRFLKPIFGGLIKWRDEGAIRKTAWEYIHSLEIKCTSERQPVIELSGGNQQKICLAKAFTMKPEIMFVSEPTRGIDIGAKRLVLDTLRQYNQDYGTTIIMVSSELEELRSICDRIAVIDEGCVAGILPPGTEASEFGLLMTGVTARKTTQQQGAEQ